MDNLKTKICNRLISDRERSVLEYNSKLEEVAYTDNVSTLHSLIVNIYNNDRTELQNAIIELMGITLTNTFFREAFINREENSVAFSNDEYKVHFYTNGNKIIELEYLATSNPWEVEANNPLLSDEEKEYNQRLKALLEKYLNNKSFANLKTLSQLYMKDNTASSISKYFKTYKQCTEEMLDSINKILKTNEEREGLKNLSLKIYKMKESEALRFLNTLDDLKIYKEENWIFALSNEVHQRMLLDNNEIHFNEISRDD